MNSKSCSNCSFMENGECRILMKPSASGCCNVWVKRDGEPTEIKRCAEVKVELIKKSRGKRGRPRKEETQKVMPKPAPKRITDEDMMESFEAVERKALKEPTPFVKAEKPQKVADGWCKCSEKMPPYGKTILRASWSGGHYYYFVENSLVLSKAQFEKHYDTDRWKKLEHLTGGVAYWKELSPLKLV